MDKNKDGVVTIDEFIDCCQNVRRASPISRRRRVGLAFTLLFVLQDENIMRSMHLFENVL